MSEPGFDIGRLPRHRPTRRRRAHSLVAAVKTTLLQLLHRHRRRLRRPLSRTLEPYDGIVFPTEKKPRKWKGTLPGPSS